MGSEMFDQLLELAMKTDNQQFLDFVAKVREMIIPKNAMLLQTIIDSIQ